MRLGSSIATAVAQASSCSSDSTPSLGTFRTTGEALLKKKKKVQIADCFVLDLCPLKSSWLKFGTQDSPFGVSLARGPSRMTDPKSS